MSETCRCFDEEWWRSDGGATSMTILCETCGKTEELDENGYCDCDVKECSESYWGFFCLNCKFNTYKRKKWDEHEKQNPGHDFYS